MRADAAANFGSANQSLDAIAFSRENTNGRSVSQPDSAAAIDSLCRSECTWPIVDSRGHTRYRINSATRFAGQSDSPECQPAYARRGVTSGECAGVDIPAGGSE